MADDYKQKDITGQRDNRAKLADLSGWEGPEVWTRIT